MSTDPHDATRPDRVDRVRATVELVGAAAVTASQLVTAAAALMAAARRRRASCR